MVILTDIGRPDLEPDNTESLVHLLCYAIEKMDEDEREYWMKKN